MASEGRGCDGIAGWWWWCRGRTVGTARLGRHGGAWSKVRAGLTDRQLRDVVAMGSGNVRAACSGRCSRVFRSTGGPRDHGPELEHRRCSSCSSPTRTSVSRRRGGAVTRRARGAGRTAWRSHAGREGVRPGCHEGAWRSCARSNARPAGRPGLDVTARLATSDVGGPLRAVPGVVEPGRAAGECRAAAARDRRGARVDARPRRAGQPAALQAGAGARAAELTARCAGGTSRSSRIRGGAGIGVARDRVRRGAAGALHESASW